MFADSILETSWAQRKRRSWTTLTSFGLEAVVVGLLLLFPLWRTVGLPAVRAVSTPISAERPHAEPAPVSGARTGGGAVASTTAVNARFVAPGHISPTVSMTDDGATPQVPTGCGDCLPGVEGRNSREGLPPSIFGGSRPIALPAQPTLRAFRTSSILEGSLIRQVRPVYPPRARSARIQGTVVLFAVINKAGTIERLHAVSGHPMLIPAAIEAVSQWRYRPYILNNEPIEVETEITVNFILAGN